MRIELQRAVAVVVVASAVLGAAAPALADADPALSRSVDGPAHDILALVHAGRQAEAERQAARYVADYPDHPLPLMIQARVIRETFQDQDDSRDLREADTEPFHALLDKVIAMTDAGLEAAPDDPEMTFYRGYAWMFKSQLHALAGSYYSAGRAAARGMGDLTAYLEHEPYDPDARGIVGTFWYFADTLPGVIKFVKALLFIPGGDREKGLAYLDYACVKDGLYQLENRIIRAFIAMYFEGAFEAGAASFAALLADYPRYVRLAEPLAVVAFFDPVSARRLLQVENAAVARHVKDLEDQSDWPTIRRLRFYRGFYEMVFGSPDVAVEEFAALCEQQPERPDWLRPQSLLNLGMLRANRGEQAEATACFQQVLDDATMARYHELARELLQELSVMDDLAFTGDMAFVAQIYGDDPEAAAAGLHRYYVRHGDTALVQFYRGELALMTGDVDGGVAAYEGAVSQDLLRAAAPYRYFASCRLAEIRAVQGDYKAARQHLEQAGELATCGPLLRLMTKARSKYFDRLDSGRVDGEPSLARPASPSPDASIQAIR